MQTAQRLIPGILIRTVAFRATTRTNSSRWLGVFLGPSGQPVSAPPTIDFTPTTGIGVNFTTLSPQIGQLFIIGDGTTSSAQTRTYYVPTGATELYLGFADSSNFQGPCGQYADNSGSVNRRNRGSRTGAVGADAGGLGAHGVGLVPEDSPKEFHHRGTEGIEKLKIGDDRAILRRASSALPPWARRAIVGIWEHRTLNIER